MLFSPENADKVMRKLKTQTRRPVKPGETSGPRFPHLPESPTNRVVYGANGRMKWYTGGDYAVQPGRGKHGIGRFKVLSIRRARVQDISGQDAYEEGVRVMDFWTPARKAAQDVNGYRRAHVDGFAALWASIYSGEYAWSDNPMCWALEFEVVEGNS